MPQDPSPHITIHEDIDLDRPVLIAAFKGWNDAGDAASFAAKHLGKVWGAHKVVSIDPEEFYDFQNVRPHVRLEDGVTRKIAWPRNEFWSARVAGSGDALILLGIEPSHRWRTFSELIVDVAQRHDVKLVITLGALLADVPHTRPVPITGTAVDPELIHKLGLERSHYEGPTGIVGVIHDACARAGLDSASLWAAVPHYLAVTPNPKAALALVERTVELTHIPADIGILQHATSMYEERVAEIVATDDDVQGYVQMLEERADEQPPEEMADLTDIPSGDSIAEELERFLRDHEE